MTAHDLVIRALVFVAWTCRGTNEYRDSLERIITVDALWPLIEYEQATITAERDLEARVTAIEAEPWRVHELWPPQLPLKMTA